MPTASLSGIDARPAWERDALFSMAAPRQALYDDENAVADSTASRNATRRAPAPSAPVAYDVSQPTLGQLNINKGAPVMRSMDGVTITGDSIVVLNSPIRANVCQNVLHALWILQEQHYNRRAEQIRQGSSAVRLREDELEKAKAFGSTLAETLAKRLQEHNEAFAAAVDRDALANGVGRAPSDDVMRMSADVSVNADELLRVAKSLQAARSAEVEAQFVDLTEQPIEFYVMSQGGALLATLGVVDAIVDMQNTDRVYQQRSASGELVTHTIKPRIIRTHVLGYALSAGFLFGLSGNLRTMGPNSTILMHEISSMIYGKQSEQLAHMQNTEYTNAQVLRYIGERTGLVQYAYYGTVDGKDAYVYIAPATRGYEVKAYCMMGEPHPKAIKYDAGNPKRVTFDRSKPVLVDHQGQRVVDGRQATFSAHTPQTHYATANKTMAPMSRSNGNGHAGTADRYSAPDEARQLARVNRPMMQRWVEVVNARVRGGATFATDVGRLVQETDTVSKVMMVLAAEDNFLSAAQSKKLGFVNDNMYYTQQRLAADPHFQLVVNTDDDF